MRVDLFDIEVESLREFSTFTQRSFGDVEQRRDRARRPSWPPSSASWRRSPRPTRRTGPDIAELLPVDRFHAFLDLARRRRRSLIAAEEDVEPALRDHWQDVCAAFHDTDAHHLYVKPDDVLAGARRAGAGPALERSPATSRSSSARRRPTPPRAVLKEAETELEKLVRSGYRTTVTWANRGEGERAAYNLNRVKASWNGGDGAR